MRIDQDRCTGCLECIDFCPMGAIRQSDTGGTAYVDQDACVECGVCLRVGCCQFDAIWQPELEWPRILRSQFSNPGVSHPSTAIYGRGTDETKTNDVTGRYPPGAIGIAAELGRPGVGTRLRDVETVARAILPLGVEFEKDNPTYFLFQDLEQVRMRPDVLDERVLSAILEFKTTLQKAPQVLKALHRVAAEIDAVMSVNIGSMIEPNGSLPAQKAAEQAGFHLRPNGKSNLGLGRPLVQGPTGGRE